MLSLIYVGLGGFFGSIIRHIISTFLNRVTSSYSMPVGSLVVNILGCFLIGLVSVKLLNSSASKETYLFLTTGFLGGFTTYSAFGNETFTLLKEDQWTNAILLSVFHILFGLLSVTLGAFVGKKI